MIQAIHFDAMQINFYDKPKPSGITVYNDDGVLVIKLDNFSSSEIRISQEDTASMVEYMINQHMLPPGLFNDVPRPHRRGKVTASLLTIRSGPSAAYNSLGVLNYGAEVEILDLKNNYYEILPCGSWVNANWIRINEDA